MLLVWLVAITVFVVLQMNIGETTWMHWLAFVWAVPLSLIVWLIFNSVWFNPRWNFLIVSLLMWSILAGIYITLWHVVDFWMIFILGIPGQVIILLWSLLRYSDEEDDDQSASAGTKRRRQGKDAGEGGEDGPQDDER